MFQPLNAIHIVSFIDDKEDKELSLMMPFLRMLADVMIYIDLSLGMCVQCMNGYSNMLIWRKWFLLIRMGRHKNSMNCLLLVRVRGIN